MRNVTVAATQMACNMDRSDNLKRAVELVRQAADKGAQIVLLQELFETLYFCQKPSDRYFDLATSPRDNPAIEAFTKVARDLKVVIPVSFFERDDDNYFNSLCVIDADGQNLGIYRKTHIPDGPGYEEKSFFQPGDTGFRVFDTAYGRIGCGICWDQWFPETARCLALMGAEILLFPTAIGSEPHDPQIDSCPHWQTVMCGHAAANIMPVVASNRIGTETIDDSSVTFYGSSFICDACGQIKERLGPDDMGIITHTFDLDATRAYREKWGVFFDRRPSCYDPLVWPNDYPGVT